MIVNIYNWKNSIDWQTFRYLTMVWCDSNCEGRWERRVNDMVFELESDYLLFTLRWFNTQ